MSDIIKLLPDSVANQIAAGEVIQRPSSVIKELVENAIDAGATSIQVIVVDAGKTCIQVVDNGKGMSETDARLAFERHATSKITQASDLFNLQTMGFRGEALASIAAVAQVELKTRTADEEIGTCLQIEGSKVIDQQPDACSVGANFSVKNLFYNIPARRKFLKSNQTEMSNILTEFERVALANPQLSFKLYSGDSVLQNLPAGNFRSRIRGIFGKNVDSKLLPVSVETSLAKINGYVGTPESSKKKGFHQYFFVNGRYMKHPYFSKAIMTAYERLIPDNEQVSYFIDFQVDPSKIDVNIHPAKTEIKFEDDSAIWQILLASVREALGKFNAIPTLDFDTENCPSIPAFNPEYTEVKQPQVHLDSSFNPFDQPQETPLSENGCGAARRDGFSRSASGWETPMQNLRIWISLFRSETPIRRQREVESLLRILRILCMAQMPKHTRPCSMQRQCPLKTLRCRAKKCFGTMAERKTIGRNSQPLPSSITAVSLFCLPRQEWFLSTSIAPICVCCMTCFSISC